MAQPDFDPIAFVEDWLAHVVEYRKAPAVLDPSAIEAASWLGEHLPVLLALAEREGGPGLRDSTSPRPGIWADTYEPAGELLGRLRHRDLITSIREGAGPSADASRFHERVWDAARHAWSDGLHRESVGNAATAIDQMTQAKAGVHLAGTALYDQVFSLTTPSEDHPRLRFYDAGPEGSDSWKSRHNGAKFLGMGCASGIRNWAAHTLDEADEQVALEYLAALSVLARWVDQAHRKTG